MAWGVDHAQEQRQFVRPSDGKQEGPVQHKVHFLARESAGSIILNNSVSCGLAAFLVNQYPVDRTPNEPCFTVLIISQTVRMTEIA